MTRCVATAFGLLVAAASVQAQAPLEGQVLGPDGPLPDVPVALHRVTPEGGANIDEATSDADGRFSFTIEFAGDSAVYFAALRFGGELYVGPPIRGAVPPAPYVIRVGEGAGVMQSRPMARPQAGRGSAAPAGSQGNGTVLVVFLLIGAGVVAGVGYAVWQTLGTGPSRRRRLLVELAGVEESLDSDPLSDAERTELEHHRASLRHRLAPDV